MISKSSYFFILPVIILFSGCGNKIQTDQIEYPEGYRDWTHVKSMILEPGHPLYDSFGGIHHLYANDAAMEGYKSGRFPDGSVIIFDLLEAVKEDNAVTEGNRKVLGVMKKDSEMFKETGGWGFEGFKGDSKERVVTDAAKECFSCHLSQKENDFVFSSFRK